MQEDADLDARRRLEVQALVAVAVLADLVLLVFDLTRRSTFERLPLWLEQALA